MSALLTTEEVAEILRVSPRTVRRMGASGDLERIHVGRRLTRYTPDSLAAFIGNVPETTEGEPASSPSEEGSDGPASSRRP